MTNEDKELKHLKQIENLKKGREARAANIAARKAEKEAAAKAQAATTATLEPKEAPVEPKPTETPQKEKRPLSNLFGRKPEAKKEGPAENAVTGVHTVTKPENKPSDLGQKLGRSWYFFLGGALLLALGVPIMLAGNSTANPIVIVLGAGLSVFGGYLVYRGFNTYSVRVVHTTVKGKVKKENCNILRLKTDAVTFDYDAEPIGKEMRCRNDGKYYFVQYHGLDGNGTIEAFKMPSFNPDDQYYDPAEAVNCLFMAAVKAYLNYSAGGLAKFNMVILGVVIGLEVIGLMAIK